MTGNNRQCRNFYDPVRKSNKPLTKAYQYWFVLQFECNKPSRFSPNTCVQLMKYVWASCRERFPFLGAMEKVGHVGEESA